ncbi:helix-turn-helix domain-containing protein [Alicyclobacillus pomorum]|uniref:helix-turn-helix domain-containing protein n=1 Tax=Alicyclobacillus pomorum TaxID=204470 RepID=UPI00041EE2CA|nr:helix-turn-helix domain-containing protein [Alicyclobacillus pomorum]
MPSIGEKLAKLRRDKGWTLKQLSEASGVSVSHISAIENHTRPNPSLQQIAKLARALGTPLTYFDDDASTSTPDAHTVTESTLSAEPIPSMKDDLFEQFVNLYDEETRRFIVSESSKPYVALAMRLAQQDGGVDASSLLQIIAQFMRERQQDYKPKG